METAIKIYTDGGCSGNPGPGGWAFVIVGQTPAGSEVLAENKGGEKSTTNNRMELRAVIESLKTLKTLPGGGALTVLTDSQYVQKGISDWIRKWKQNSWRTSDKKPVKNQDLWMELDCLAGDFSIDWQWVKGHAGHPENERCDELARAAI